MDEQNEETSSGCPFCFSTAPVLEAGTAAAQLVAERVQCREALWGHLQAHILKRLPFEVRRFVSCSVGYLSCMAAFPTPP